MAKELYDLLPRELKVFAQLFQTLTHRHPEYELWNDFLEIIICSYARQQMEDRYLKIIKKYRKEEVGILVKMFAEMVKLYSERLMHGAFYDGLGAFYESVINTPSKAGRTGQFFTPENVCAMMAKCTLSEDSANKQLNINDPACGSGRMLLAAHAVAPGNYYFAEDLDPMCCLLTSVNFLFHNMEGQVVCHDSLNPTEQTYRFGYEIKRLSAALPIPVIRSIPREQSITCMIYDAWLQERLSEIEAGKEAQTGTLPKPKQPITPALKKAAKAPIQQLSIF